MDTTMMWSVLTISEPSCWSPAPLARPPPWIMNRTGSPRPAPSWAAWPGWPAGAKTLRNRQSSVSSRGPLPLGSWAQRFPYEVASRTPVQGCTGWGACQRNAPTGGAAYGTPRNWSTPSSCWPWSLPSSVETINLPDDPPVPSAACAACAGVVADDKAGEAASMAARGMTAASPTTAGSLRHRANGKRPDFACTLDLLLEPAGAGRTGRRDQDQDPAARHTHERIRLFD